MFHYVFSFKKLPNEVLNRQAQFREAVSNFTSDTCIPAILIAIKRVPKRHAVQVKLHKNRAYKIIGLTELQKKVSLFLLNPEGTVTSVAGRLSKGKICYISGTVPAKDQKSATSVALCS